MDSRNAAQAGDFVGLDHVQLAAPVGCEPDARRFFGELLGLPELPKPPELAARGGCWFQCGAQQIHIGVEKEFRAAKKAHPALRLRDRASAEAVRARLTSAGIETRSESEVPGVYRFFADDPFGNRLEFVSEP
jgi:catechol 2,3-dioxygenase-like lactoylglutathione lyase family enzyme